MSRKKLIGLIQASVAEQPINKKFLTDVMMSIERMEFRGRRKPSPWYKPSSMNCMRNMYFTRIEAQRDEVHREYVNVGMADTGTRRHEAIQDVLLFMNETSDWEYIDVAAYVEKKQAEGKCRSLVVKGRAGAETHLIDKALCLSFRCDGILKYKPTSEYFLFEFKNQASFKYMGKVAVDKEHHNQVVCYCTALDLDKALVLYENRDVCSLECPELFIVTDDMKNKLIADIMECEQYVSKLIPPAKCENTKACRWCDYKSACKKVGY